MDGQVARIGGRRGADRFHVWRPDGNWSLRRPKRRWEGNVKMDLPGMSWWCMDWIAMAEDRNRKRMCVNVIMSGRIPQNAGNFLTSWGHVRISRTQLDEVSWLFAKFCHTPRKQIRMWRIYDKRKTFYGKNCEGCNGRISYFVRHLLHCSKS